MKITKLITLLSLIVLAIYFSTFSGCSKEYSCEGCFISIPSPPRDTTIIEDTTIIRDTSKIDSTINFPICTTCNVSPTYILNRWSFRNYQSLVCGNTYYASLDSGYIITVRGIQDCVSDTDFVITGRFTTQTFEADQTNVAASYSNFLLYAPNNVILAVTGGTPGTPLTMNMVLDTFNFSTGIASIRFFGYAYTNKGGSSYLIGDSSYISEGRINVKIR